VSAELARTPFPNSARPLRDGRTLRWWVEILAILGFYVVYSAIRNLHGGNTHTPPHAFDHARQIMSFERHVGLFHEQTIQEWALHVRPLIITANYFYGSLHFIVTIFAGVFLYRRFSDDYPRFRNTLAIATAVALVGFALYPLAPPRMYDGMHFILPNLGFVDTLAKDPTFWSFSSGGMQTISNQYAAMPSVHIAWATWCAFALAPRLKAPALRVLAASYPLITLTVIVVTANHYIIDAVGGLVILLVGWWVSGRITRAGRVPAAATA
jgi:hypothetical protein